MALFQPDASTFDSLKSTPKTIVITGGASGLGLSTAQLLSSLNPKHNLVLIDLQAPPSSFQHDASRLLVRTCDITSWADQRSAFEAAYAKFGRIDCVFVNAGIGECGNPFFSDALDAEGKLAAPDHRTLSVDLNAASDTTKLAIHYLRKNGAAGGQIVITSSLAGYLASAGLALYSAAKHGVLGLMRALKLDCAKLGISISVVAPAITVTPLMAKVDGEVAAPPEVLAEQMVKAGVPINKPESVALAVCWLFDQGPKGNGAGIFVQGDRFVDLERGLAKAREQWMSKEMLDMFRGGRGSVVFDKLIDDGRPAKSKI